MKNKNATKFLINNIPENNSIIHYELNNEGQRNVSRSLELLNDRKYTSFFEVLRIACSTSGGISNSAGLSLCTEYLQIHSLPFTRQATVADPSQTSNHSLALI